MIKQEIQQKLNAYFPENKEEVHFKEEMMAFLEQYQDVISRSNVAGQFTISAWVINPERTKALMVHHKKLDRWLQIGGHLEVKDKSLKEAALREVREESGLQNVKSLSEKLFDIDVHLIPTHKKVAAHHHLDIRFVFEADEKAILTKNDEVKDIQWQNLEELRKNTDNTSIKRMIYKTFALS